MSVTAEPALQIVVKAYSRRRTRNPSYSLRSFARDIGLSPGALSQILSGKRSFSQRAKHTVADRIELNWKERQILIGKNHGKASKSEEDFMRIAEDEFDLIAEWYHFAMLNLLYTKDFCFDLKWIARRLGISIVEAQAAWDRLLRLGLIKETDVGWKRTILRLTTGTDKVSAAIRRSHRTRLQKALESLETDDIEKRDITGMTLAFQTAQMVAAKEYIAEFRREFSARFGSITGGEEVYQLNVQFHPVTYKVAEAK